MKLLNFPGCCCTMKGSGKAYAESLQAVLNAFGVEMETLEDWNCCGATICSSVDQSASLTMPLRNLSLAEKQGGEGKDRIDMMAPCSACFMVLNHAGEELAKQTPAGLVAKEALAANDLQYSGRVKVRHPLDLLANEIGAGAIAERITRPLKGLKVASYYGCLLVRPSAPFDNPNDPTSMDRVVRALGAEPLAWSAKTRCCGGSLMATAEEIGLALSGEVFASAAHAGADVIVTACPICEYNLECSQRKLSESIPKRNEVPVVYFSQLIGVALGLPGSDLGLGRLMIPLEPALEKAALKEHAHV